MRRFGLAGTAALTAMACSQQDAAETPAAGLPAGVLAAFHDHLDRISGGALVCRDGDIAAAATVSGDINADRRPDYVVDTRSLNCQARRDGPAVAYFCGTGSCAFPLIVSQGEAWQTVALMSGNQARIVQHYRETRIEIREGARGVPGGGITVREYTWREGRLVRTGEWVEGVEARRLTD
ncbi:MAG: hypothetical protein CMH94_09010 [Oceanicaulis sp.]|nr:hypothetical protein [Oceanicaulis sp.]MAZ91780.1 hypothetical protein [Maricaulis sp.]MBI75726.1 hypothetical protein [Oceanicaulis sp.]